MFQPSRVGGVESLQPGRSAQVAGFPGSPWLPEVTGNLSEELNPFRPVRTWLDAGAAMFQPSLVDAPELAWSWPLAFWHDLACAADPRVASQHVADSRSSPLDEVSRDICFVTANVLALHPGEERLFQDDDLPSMRRELLAREFDFHGCDVIGIQEACGMMACRRTVGKFHMVASAAAAVGSLAGGAGGRTVVRGCELWVHQRLGASA
jgi:hypothetical protein